MNNLAKVPSKFNLHHWQCAPVLHQIQNENSWRCQGRSPIPHDYVLKDVSEHKGSKPVSDFRPVAKFCECAFALPTLSYLMLGRIKEWREFQAQNTNWGTFFDCKFPAHVTWMQQRWDHRQPSVVRKHGAGSCGLDIRNGALQGCAISPRLFDSMLGTASSSSRAKLEAGKLSLERGLNPYHLMMAYLQYVLHNVGQGVPFVGWASYSYLFPLHKQTWH